MSSIFPPAGIKEDSKDFKFSKEDKAIHSESDGGYVYSRPRHARRPRRHLETKLTNLTQAQFEQVEAMTDKFGTYMDFAYKIPTTGELLNVRFESIPTAIYKGIAGVHLYDYSEIKLIEI